MKLKPITAIAVLLLVVASLSAAGCTTSTNTTTPTSLPTSDTAAAITNEFSQSGYVIIIPFVKSTNAAGIVTYTGVVKDGENSLTPYTHNLTLEVTKNRNDTTTRFYAWVRNATQRGYTGSVQDARIARYWSGTQGAAVMNATHGVWIVGQQPKGFTTVLYASQPPKSVSALSDGYLVSADFATEA